MNLPRRALVYARITRQLVRIGVVRKSQFRWEFFNQVVMDLLFYGSNVLLFEILFGMDRGVTIGGWDRDAMRVYLGMVFVHDAFSMTWLGQGWHFGDDLKKGNLDVLRLRPAHPTFLYFFQRFSPEGLTNMALAVGYLLWGLAGAGLDPSVGLAARLVWALSLGFLGETILHVLYASAEFYFVNSDLGRLFSESFTTLGERPLEIYHRRLRLFLVFLLPVAALAWVPASLVLGRMSALAGLGYSLWFLGLGWAIVRFWRWSFRRYESAMG